MGLKEKLKELRGIIEAATPGPWEWSDGHIQGSYLGDTLIMVGDTYEDGEYDTRFIATARTALPQALDALEVLWGALEKVAYEPLTDDAEYCREKKLFVNSPQAVESREALAEAAAKLGAVSAQS